MPLTAHSLPSRRNASSPNQIRCILNVRYLVEASSRWRVGNGESIHIWVDRWVPSSTDFCPKLKPTGYDESSRVASLIDHDNGGWRVSTIRSLFYPLDVEAILTIPLGRTVDEDSLIWHFKLNGRFSVRSAHHLALSIAESSLASCSDQ
ncbi:hypothetical protein Salat_1706100 [Sesamum alatum]|uniref:Reverse transcriptase zinc-binding domain-containing protein n=1 Tax=Sesamum alatum TaxID=300844 RepID=A0AAE1Y7W7_9LAMI|nr:hypothetical protein Salat_1706100 [Sesamum alatum]